MAKAIYCYEYWSRKKAKNDFEKDFFKLMDHAASRETMENVRKHKDNKLVATARRRNSLVSERKYHSTKLFKQYLLAIEIKKNRKTYE